MGQSARGSRRDAMWGLLLSSLIIGLAAGDVNFGSHHHNQEARGGRQEGGVVPGGIDFSGCEEDPETGLCCIDKEETVTTIKKDPILECTHKNTEQCHYTYVTQFTPTQEEVCEETFEKSCSITFKQQAFNETVRKCYTPIEKVSTVRVPRFAKLSTSPPAQPSMWRSSLASLSVTPVVRNSLLRSVELVVSLRKESRSATIRSSPLLSTCPRSIVT